MKKKIFLALMAVGLLAASSANALTVTGTAPGGRSAEAIITINGSTLNVQMINNGVAVSQPSDVLTALLFTLPSGVSLTPVSASLGSGATVSYGSIVNNVGEGWNYSSGLSGTPGGQTSGISAAGLGVFGQPNFYSVPVTPLDGIGYGLANGFNNPNGGILNGGPLISSEVDFNLAISGTLDLSAITGAAFIWGTSFSETPPPPGVPDGGTTMALLGSALVGIEFLRRKLLRA